MGSIAAEFKLSWPGFSLDVDLNLPSRGVTALFGHSGSGKTTLLRCIAGLEPVSQGRLSIDGEVWQDCGRRMPTHQRPIGYVFQEASLFAHRSVMGNLRYGLERIAGPSRVSLDQAIELLGIGHLLERKPDLLSGGERQRVAIARALAVSPRLLLMDEPLAALDPARKREVLPYLERLVAELDIPLIYVTHAPDEVARLADYVVVMEQGRALAQGPLTEVLTRLDLPIQIVEDSGAVLHARVGFIDMDWHLARIDFDGGSLWSRNPGLPLGSQVRVQVLARDVSLAREYPSETSIQNLLPGRVDAVGDDAHPGLVLVRVQVGAAMLIARLTKRAAAALDIAPNQQVWVQVKSVALLE